MINDEISINYKDENGFLNMLKGYVEEGKWINICPSITATIPAEDIDPLDFAGLERLAAHEDTERHTGMYYSFEGEKLPLGRSAMKTLFDRCRISGSVLKDMSRKSLSSVLNTCLVYSAESALLRVFAGKVRAVLSSGTDKSYSVMDMDKIFGAASDYFKNNFDKSEFIEAEFSHEICIAKWQVEDDRIDEAYKSQFVSSNKRVKGEITVASSDTGYSGANIYYSIRIGGVNIALGKPLECEHRSGGDLSVFNDNLGMIFSKIQESIENISALQEIKIYHPVECLINIVKKLGISKKLAADIIDTYRALNDGDDDTAFNLYYQICSIGTNATSKGVGRSSFSMLDLEERIARALTLDFKEFDRIDY